MVKVKNKPRVVYFTEVAVTFTEIANGCESLW
jgi:hypothetical protein